MQTGKLNNIWSGLNDKQLSGVYTWADGWPVMYTNWDVNQPTSTGGCVMVNSTGKWSDVPCNNTYPYICKISKGKSHYMSIHS